MNPGWHYTAYYCEENIWYLGQETTLLNLPRKAVFISNRKRQCALLYQKASFSPLVPVVWDYHVVLICYNHGWQLWDLDTTLNIPTIVTEYINQTFGALNTRDGVPYFRVVDFDEFRTNFSSDRSHMRRPNGKWVAPPPTWPPIMIGTSSNLFDFIDTDKKSFGEVLDMPEFLQQYGS